MSDNNGSGWYGLAVFMLLFNMLFPIMAYTFTTHATAFPESYDIAIDPNTLIMAGYNWVDGESKQVVFDSSAQEFTVLNKTIRVRWVNGIVKPDGIKVFRQSPIERWLGTWLFPVLVPVWSMDNVLHDYLHNDTVVQYWESDYNWSRFDLSGEQYTMFITATYNSNNITDTIYNLGNVTVTIGEATKTDEQLNYVNFVDWYLGLIFGDQNYGMPEFMSWLIRITTTLTLISALMLGKHMVSNWL